jgi:hypothetical protein
MATQSDLQRLARRALLTAMKANGPLTALVPAASIAPDGEPTWPFVLIESPRTLKLRAACVRGATVSFDVHAFAGPRQSGEQVVETGYDHVSRIGSAIEGSIDEARLTLENDAICSVRFSDTQYIRDGEPDAWHFVTQVNCRVLST